jgi:hypothetical protein
VPVALGHERDATPAYQVPLIEEATRLEFAGGVTALLGRGVSVYAQAGYQYGLDSAFIRNGIQGDIGLRYVW